MPTDDPAWEGLLRGIAAASAPVSPAQAPPLAVGETLGRFELKALLGAGGFGVVYRAHDTVLGRDVALKLPWRRGELATRGFLTEARTVAALSDPHLVSVYDVGECDGFPFIALELVTGRSLRSRVAGRPLEPADARSVLLGVARALRAVHARGWVHLDVKPDNVVVADDGSVKLLDFGLAQPVGHDATVAGTPEYAPPEAGASRPPDARFDVFSFGVLGQELLTGVRSTRALPALAAAGGLGRLLRRCLAVEPGDRPASGAELVTALEARQRRPGLGLAALGLGFVVIATVVAVSSPPRLTTRQHVRLTAHRVERPIRVAALSHDGRDVLAADDDGLWRFEVAQPTRTLRVSLPQPGEVGLVRAQPGGGWVVSSSFDAGTALWRVTGDGRATLAASGSFRTADLGPSGEVLEVDDGVVTVRRGLGAARRLARDGEGFIYAHFSGDGQLALLATQQFQRSGWLRCFEVMSAMDLSPRWKHCSERLTQPFMPVVVAWHPQGVVWVETQVPGAGSGVVVELQPLSPAGWPDGAPRRLDAIDEETVYGLSVSAQGEVLSLRHEVLRSTELLVKGALQSVAMSDFDERPTGLGDDGTLWRTQLRARIPTVVGSVGPAQVELSLTGWLSAARPLENGEVLVWRSPGSTDGGPVSWALVRALADGGVEPVELPGALDEVPTVSRALPPSAEVHCAGTRPPCLLGWPGERYTFYELAWQGPPRVRWTVDDPRKRYGHWTVTERATVLLAQGPELTELDLSGRTLARWPLDRLEVVYAVGVIDGAPVVAGPSRATGRYQLISLGLDGGSSVLFDDPLKAITDVVSAPDGGVAVGVRVIDTDVWLSRGVQ